MRVLLAVLAMAALGTAADEPLLLQKPTLSKTHIVKIIEKATLPPRAAKNALAVFQKLGEAEAAVHQVPIEKVHFHEVGAADSIADIVGACLAFELLGVDRIACSPINVGSGTVKLSLIHI